jgi:cyclopropane fatty-acyl-phospholipid synthase-like methyltransferase
MRSRCETRTVLRFLRATGLDCTSKILDVGCGYGRILNVLTKEGHSPVGLEINSEIRKDVISRGFSCLSPQDFQRDTTIWDVVIMSHVIEHFDFMGLIEFMETYVARLRTDGYLIILTPLASRHFYDTCDHVRPYPPRAVTQIVGPRGAQVQRQLSGELLLEKLCFRRRSLHIANTLSLQRPTFSAGKVSVHLANMILRLLFLASFGLLGLRDGWIGLYRKCR